MNKKIQITTSILYLSLFLLSGCSKDINQQINTEEKKNDIITTNQDKLNPASQNNNSCPRGLVCSSPGRCSLFLDQNNNKTCDLGENTKNN